MYAYAGFIDGLSRAGLEKANDSPSKERIKDPGNPTADRAGITPQHDVRDYLKGGDKRGESLRAVGFTTAHVVPYGGMFPGYGALVSLGGIGNDDGVLAPRYSLYSELATADHVYPSTILGVIAKWRELYKQASFARSYESVYAANKSGIERPPSNSVLEAFYPVIEKRVPVVFKSEKALDCHRVLALQSDLGFPLILAEVKEGWDVIAKVKSSGARVFLSLALPDDGAESGNERQNDESLGDVERAALERRLADFMTLYEGQAYAFQSAGIPFGFSTLTAKSKDVHHNLCRMIKAGLKEDQALAALTIVPAQMLGLSDRLGTIDNGKIANLVISDMAYFKEKAQVRYVFVEGVMYEIEAKMIDKTKADKRK
jgi:hypothetical protein